MAIRNPFSGLVWDKQKTLISVIVALAIVCILLLVFRGGNKEQAGTPVPDAQTPPSATQPAVQPTLVQDLETVAGYFPGMQVNTASVPYTCVVKVDVLNEASRKTIETGAKEELGRDGVKVKEVKLQELTIVLSEAKDRLTGFIARVIGTLEDDNPLAATDVYVGDGSWTAQRSAEFARQLRQNVESNPLYSLQAGGGGHRVRLEINFPHHRPVENND